MHGGVMSIFFVNLVTTVAGILSSFLTIYSIVVLIACLLSFVNPDPYNVVVRTIRMLTEPVFYRIRKWMPFVFIGGLDLSPIVLLVAIQLFQGVVIKSMLQLVL